MSVALPTLGAQRSVEWLMNRCGWCTASRFKDVMAKLKDGKPAKARADYAWEIVVERLTGRPSEHFANAAMAWGTEHEPFAVARYEESLGALVTEAGFIRHPTIEWVGGSPDGLVGRDGGIEIKSPFNSGVHLTTVRDGMPVEHGPQVQGLMWVTGRKWWDFISFDPRMPEPLDLYVQRIERDEKFIAELETDVGTFLADVEKQVDLFLNWRK